MNKRRLCCTGILVIATLAKLMTVTGLYNASSDRIGPIGDYQLRAFRNVPNALPHRALPTLHECRPPLA